MQANPEPRRAHQAAIIPVLDLGPWLADRHGADLQLARELRRACENVGFYFIRNHGVPQELIDAAFAQTARFHRLPLADKLALRINRHRIGYLPMGDSKVSTIDSVASKNSTADLNEAFFVRRERRPDDPDVLSGKLYRGLNQWPQNLPGFRETVVSYWNRMEALGQRLLEIYDLALEMPRGYFRARFENPHVVLRLSHYPARSDSTDGDYGIAAHTDSGFMTLLPQSEVPGLEIRLPDRSFIPVPKMPGTFLVNSGDAIHRWTNGRFRSTVHRANNRSTVDRYAMPYFYDPNSDVVLECLPSCQGPDNPPRFPTISYGDYYAWFITANYRIPAESAP